MRQLKGALCDYDGWWWSDAEMVTGLFDVAGDGGAESEPDGAEPSTFLPVYPDGWRIRGEEVRGLTTCSSVCLISR